jgi:hypothetical protein
MVPLTVDKGFPLEVVLTEKVPMKLNAPVHGKIVDPVYVFDREVIPSGTEVLGKITGLKSPGKWKRVSSMLGGDFTPLHDPEIRFDTLVFADGKHVPIETSVVSKGDILVRFDKGRTHAYTTTVQQPGKELIHTMLWRLSPYHPQSVATGTTFKATVERPLEFGNALVGSRTLDYLGAKPAAGSIIYARLMTALNSKTATPGTSIQAILTRPLYSLDYHMIYPAGSTLQGEVVEARAAGFFSRGGELELKFNKISPPMIVMSSISQIREIQGRLVGVEVAMDLTQLHIDKDGMAEVVRTNGRFLAPAFALVGAMPMLGSTASSFPTAFAESYGSSFLGRATGGSAGLGIPASVSGMMVPTVGLGLGAYGVGRAIYSSMIGHGKNIDFPADTPIEVRLD